MKTVTASPLKRRAFFWTLAVVLGSAAPRALAQDSSSQPAPRPVERSAPPPSASDAPATGAAVKGPAAAEAKPVPRARSAPRQKTLIVKVKEWVAEKWRQFQGVPEPSRRPVARKPPAASAPDSAPPPIGRNLPAPGVASTAKTGAGERRADPSADGSFGPGSASPGSVSGVPVHEIDGTDALPRLDIGRERRVTAETYALGGDAAAFFDKMVAHQKDSPPLLAPSRMAELKRIPRAPGRAEAVKTVVFKPKGKVSREAFDKISLDRAPENKFNLGKYVALTPEELRFLSGLLLYQRGDRCPVAIGLFHALSRSPKYAAESNYYLAMCSKKLGLTTDFVDRARRVLETGDAHYSKKILPEVSPDLPYEFIEPFGRALLKVAGDKRVMAFDAPETAGNAHYILANYGGQAGNFKLAARHGRMVPEGHAKWPQAQFLLALGEYQTGSKPAALELQEGLIAKLDADKTKAEFQALVALNLARMYFQERKFTQSREWFLKIYKDHPLWLQSLQEMGWSQLQSGDFEGAIGNMYSVQSPYFNSVYKPESYVVRAIGYLNLCQYGDAYRTLTVLEKTYRPWLERMASYRKGQPDYLGTVRKFLALKSASAEIDGLPSQVIREMVRHKDYLNLQTSLNRQIDERGAYAGLDKEVDKALSRARWLVNNSRKRADALRAKIASIKKNPALEENRLVWKAELENELGLLNGHFFEIDLFNEAKESLRGYRAEVVAGADERVERMKGRIVKVLDGRLARMGEDLARMLENNELLRYEVFAGSGENIRFQIAGGEKGNRVPAGVAPKSKTLQWDFDGEYWEDEIGHYRSSLKNNCPDTKTAGL